MGVHGVHDRTGRRRSRDRSVRIVLVTVPAVALLVAVGARGTTAALAIAGLVAVVAGFVALVARAPGARSRRGVVAVLAVGGAGLFLGGTAFGAAPSVPLRPVAPAAISVADAPTVAASPLATDALSALTVKGASPMTGYDRRDDFGDAWSDVDRNGCDTRNDVLRRDLAGRTETRCRVLAGVLRDPYTGRTIEFVRGEGTSDDVQIDHVVALADAWRTGAQRLTQRQRVALANDPVNLFAVDGPTNQQKGDGDAATWLPKRKAFRCTYVAHQIAVKRTYELWVTKAERAAMARVLSGCPDERLPAVPTPSAAATPAPSVVAGVQPGAFCATAGATGSTPAGTAVRCRTSATDDRLRWRRAA